MFNYYGLEKIENRIWSNLEIELAIELYLTVKNYLQSLHEDYIYEGAVYHSHQSVFEDVCLVFWIMELVIGVKPSEIKTLDTIPTDVELIYNEYGKTIFQHIFGF